MSKEIEPRDIDAIKELMESINEETLSSEVSIYNNIYLKQLRLSAGNDFLKDVIGYVWCTQRIHHPLRLS